MEWGIKIAYTARDEVIYLGYYGFGFRVLVLPIPEMKEGRVVIRGAGRQAGEQNFFFAPFGFLLVCSSLSPSESCHPPSLWSLFL